jgi:hypothetical protein
MMFIESKKGNSDSFDILNDQKLSEIENLQNN